MGSIALFIPHMGCPHSCSFCDQRSISGQKDPVTPETVRTELQRAFARPQPENVEIAFFGGSFTCLARERMIAFLEEARPYLESGQAASLRCSTRPDGITPEILDILERYRMRTVELGAQSLDDGVLRRNGRGHTAADVERAVSLLKSRGFRVGLQIMTGLPGDTEETLQQTVDRVAALRPDMLRVYPTVVVDGTPLARWMREGQFTPVDVEGSIRLCTPILRRMRQEQIPIIRMGLHAEKELEPLILGGGYHPAFRELCESRLLREDWTPELQKLPKGKVTLTVPPRMISRAVGQKRSNLRYWAELGYQVTVRGDETVRSRQIRSEK
jgi:histone acetyltransferase (RNA polymerase elongator complex component)